MRRCFSFLFLTSICLVDWGSSSASARPKPRVTAHAEEPELPVEPPYRPQALAQPPAALPGQVEVSHLAQFLPDGRLLTVTSFQKPPYRSEGCGRSTPEGVRYASLWHPGTGERLVTTQTADMEILAVSPDGRWLVEHAEDTCCRQADGRLRIYDLRDMNHRKVLAGYGSRFTESVSFSPDGSTLFTTGEGKYGEDKPVQMKVWSCASGRLLRSMELPGASAYRRPAFSSDGTLVAYAVDETEDTSASIVVMQSRDGRVMRRVSVPWERAGTVEFSADGETVAAADSPPQMTPSVPSIPSEISFWSVKTGELLASGSSEKNFYHDPSHWLFETVRLPGDRLVSEVTTGNRKAVVRWAGDGRVVGRFEMSASLLNRNGDVSFSPRGRFAAAITHSDNVIVWEADTFTGRVLLNGLEETPDVRLTETVSSPGAQPLWSHATVAGGAAPPPATPARFGNPTATAPPLPAAPSGQNAFARAFSRSRRPRQGARATAADSHDGSALGMAQSEPQPHLRPMPVEDASQTQPAPR